MALSCRCLASERGWRSDEEQLKTALRAALDAGYRYIDTATGYKNEHVIGDVLQGSLEEASRGRRRKLRFDVNRTKHFRILRRRQTQAHPRFSSRQNCRFSLTYVARI